MPRGPVITTPGRVRQALRIDLPAGSPRPSPASAAPPRRLAQRQPRSCASCCCRRYRGRRPSGSVGACSTLTLRQSTSSSSARIIGQRRSCTPWPISDLATMRVTEPSLRDADPGVERVRGSSSPGPPGRSPRSAEVEGDHEGRRRRPRSARGRRGGDEGAGSFTGALIACLQLRRGRRGCAGRAMDGAPDALVGAAAADVGAQRVVDVGVGGLRLAREQRGGRHEHPRLAVAALRDLLGDPGLLQRVAAVRREALDGRDRLPARTRRRA